EAQALAARRQAEAEEAKRQQEALSRQQEEARKAEELAAKQKAEEDLKAAELAKQKAEEERRQATQSQPKSRKRRAISSEPSSDVIARALPRIAKNSNPDGSDYEAIPLDALEDEDVSESVSTSGKQPQDNTELHEKVETVGLQPRAAQPQARAAAQADAVSTNTNSALSDAMASSQFILLDTGSSLVQQITQTELSANKENNVWVSNTAYDRHYSSTQYRQFSAKRSQIQIGVDHYLSKNTQVGTVLSYVRNSNVFDQASGKNTFVQANTYGKYYFDYGWYISGDIGVGQLRSQLQTQQKAKFNRIATQAGITMGNRIDINRFEILPSIGVRYSYLSPIDYKLDSDSLKVDRISIKTALAKLDLAYQFNIGEFSLKPILSMVYVINSGEGIVNIGGQNYRYKSDNQQQYSAGMALNYRSLTFNINGGAIKGRQLSNQKFLQIKMQVSF
ncbi:TPA: IgA-specific serine endopeptidase autotransporter IgaB2, partial [Haemophilus influenzae]